MSSMVKFSNTRLVKSGKTGVLQRDSDLYYTHCVGGLNIFNSANEYYSHAGAKALFEESGPFMRRVQRGALRGENGHPQFVKGMTTDEFISRVMRIDESKVCVQFKEIWLDFDAIKDSDGKPVVAIMAKLTPSGPLGPMLQKSLDNPGENVCFSVRGVTNDYCERGVNIRELKNIITFDYVNEPGIHIAEKYKTPTLESIDDKFVSEAEFINAIRNPKNASVATESSREIALNICSALGWNLPKGVTPLYTKW